MFKKLFPDKWAVYAVYQEPYDKMLVNSYWFKNSAEQEKLYCELNGIFLGGDAKYVVERIK